MLIGVVYPLAVLFMSQGKVVKRVLVGDKYHIWVPIEDNELNKAIEVDENGDYIVQGVITSSDRDEENDVIDPEGMDCTYFLEKGWIKYEHGNNPEQFIGEPIEIRVGRFTHPTLKKSVHGIFVKGRLFANRELARKAVQTIKDLQKSNTKRRMGWSIEGNVVERDPKTGKIVKSVLRNVVLTMNPVNTMTWAELAKSFAKNHEVRVRCDDFEKSMDTGSIAELMPQSLEGDHKLNAPTEEDQERFIKLLRSFVRNFQLNKSINEIREMTDDDITIEAFNFAIRNGMPVGDANLFTEYVRNKNEIIKSLAIRSRGRGGEVWMNLTDILDEELEELEKSLYTEDEDEDEEDQKDSDEMEDSGDDYEDNEEDQEEDSEDDSDEDADDGDDNDDSDDDETDSDDEDDDERTEKSFRSNLRKSLSKRHRQAFEVSDFLADMTDEIGYNLQGIEKSIRLFNRRQETLIKAIKTLFKVNQEMAEAIESLQEENEALKKSLDEVLNQPLGRRSVVSGREYHTISKSMQGQNVALTKDQIRSVLEKSFEKGELDGFELARFEAGTPIHMLRLPESVRKELGLE